MITNQEKLHVDVFAIDNRVAIKATHGVLCTSFFMPVKNKNLTVKYFRTSSKKRVSRSMQLKGKKENRAHNLCLRFRLLRILPKEVESKRTRRKVRGGGDGGRRGEDRRRTRGLGVGGGSCCVASTLRTWTTLERVYFSHLHVYLGGQGSRHGGVPFVFKWKQTDANGSLNPRHGKDARTGKQEGEEKGEGKKKRQREREKKRRSPPPPLFLCIPAVNNRPATNNASIIRKSNCACTGRIDGG